MTLGLSRDGNPHDGHNIQHELTRYLRGKELVMLHCCDIRFDTRILYSRVSVQCPQ